MAAPYNHRAIEAKWRTNWEKKPVNVNDGKKPKYYCLDMFPYPSGNGLHVGHWRGYVISDVWSRYKMLQGYYLIHPMGWDAFGLPAENYAIKMGVHPAVSTAANIKNIKRQINDIAAIYDWDMEVNTTDPDFYKWTQWIFVKMFKEGLAYEKEFPINWCPSCKTGLANEEVVNGCCERCGTPVTKKNLRQWMLRITKYADRLLNDLDKLDWPEKVKKMQTDWIGKSYGAEVDFPVEGRDEKITVYTTRPDTLHGATFMVLAPEHALAKSLATDETREAVEKYIFDASMKSNVDRLQDKEKTGVFTGTYAINPLNGEKLPIWLSDYVLADYGTGAIMCVPAHDDRDFEFAKKFDIPIIQVIAKDGKEIQNMTEAYTEASGTMINSGEWNGMESSVLKKEAPHIIEKLGIGRKTVNYKLRDWVFSRQRYWGEPIPIIHCPDCGPVPVPEEELPKTLTSYSPCFRKEKGAHGLEERGVYRIHQFEKQEMIVVCKPEESPMWFDKLWQNTVDLFRSMDIPVRTIECCSGDLADLKVKSYDVEAWSPRQKKYFEVGSCSNLGDAQARRLKIRVNGENGKYFAHTLNNTVVAPPRMLIAFLENNLQADGSVKIPTVLQPYMGGMTEIR